MNKSIGRPRFLLKKVCRSNEEAVIICQNRFDVGMSQEMAQNIIAFLEKKGFIVADIEIFEIMMYETAWMFSPEELEKFKKRFDMPNIESLSLTNIKQILLYYYLIQTGRLSKEEIPDKRIKLRKVG
ncbi:MAG: hypothetical protein PHE54_01675 [Bacilli bacterium]|nr:hypothetical protein [Bacilli bacterium]